MQHYNLKIFQLGLIVYDMEYPEDQDKTNLTITVNRNPAPPAFAPTSYTRVINESYPVGVSLVQLTATDADSVSYLLKISSVNPWCLSSAIIYCGFIYFHGEQFSRIEENLYCFEN